MLKYAKIEDNKTKACMVGDGEDIEYYKSLGMTEQDVEFCWNGNWYLNGYAPQKPAPTYDEIKEARIQYRKEHIDNQTLERQRKMANGSWTDEDEQAYLALDAEVTAYIEEHYPYNIES